MGVKFNFKRLEEPFEADWPVEVSVPQDGGNAITETFTARFRLVLKSDVDDSQPPATDADGREFFRLWFVGFGKSEETELTPELFNKLVDTPYTRSALMRAYTAFSNGVAVKN